ncbi:MAG: SMP-30/gluconolactonase/LRE family protein, partial [Tepidiformaceae bacterium]
MTDATTILLDGLSFPEAPRWHDGKLWFSDFYTHSVVKLGLDGHSETVCKVINQPSGLGWRPDGTLLIVSMLDRHLLEFTDDGLKAVANLSDFAGGPCNDMVVDSKGRAYIGNFGFERDAPQATTCIARVDPDGAVTVAADDLLFPNGTVITPDGSTLIVGETYAQRLTAFDIDADGGLSNRRVFAQFDGVFPDGISLDHEGAVWVADPVGKRVVRAFDGGRIDREISTGLL